MNASETTKFCFTEDEPTPIVRDFNTFVNYMLHGEPIPLPDPDITDPDADLKEPIHLLLKASSRVTLVPQESAL